MAFYMQQDFTSHFTDGRVFFKTQYLLFPPDDKWQEILLVLLTWVRTLLSVLEFHDFSKTYSMTFPVFRDARFSCPFPNNNIFKTFLVLGRVLT